MNAILHLAESDFAAEAGAARLKRFFERGVNIGRPPPLLSMQTVKAVRPHATLLIVDPSRPRRESLSGNFQADGYTVLTAPTATAALELLTRERVALLIADASLASGDELSLLSRLRAGGGLGTGVDQDVPLIVTASQRSDLACIRTLDAGANDYVTAPFSYMEVRARVGALLRRQTRASRGERLRVGPLEIDAVAREAWVQGRRLLLSGKEFALLRLLATEPTRLFSRTELLRTVWGWDVDQAPASSTRTLDSHACRLRLKLRAVGVGYVVNVWGEGYRLCDPVSVEAGAAPVSAGAAVLTLAVPARAA